MLRDNADSSEEIGYMKPFTEEEILAMKDDLAEVSIEINDIEIEKKEVASTFKHKLEPLVDQKKETLKLIKNKAKFVKELCYKMIDQDEQMVTYYNSIGEIVESRRIRPDEKQLKIFTLKTGTGN
jgi:hypothetical protein